MNSIVQMSSKEDFVTHNSLKMVDKLKDYEKLGVFNFSMRNKIRISKIGLPPLAPYIFTLLHILITFFLKQNYLPDFADYNYLSKKQ